MSHESDVVIVGAGPYGLALAAHLRARNVDFRIFGTPMKFWHDMPRTINLKSFAFATNIYVPGKGYSFPEWCRANKLEDFEPCSMASFAAYGSWIQQRFVPEVEPVEVSRVSADGERRFEIRLHNEERLYARRVVLATGLTHLAQMPESLAALPPELASHTFGHRDYAHLHGKEVVVVGAGASAVEAGALVHEAGARAQIFARGRQVWFHDKLGTKRSLYHTLRYPNSVFGPGMTNRLIQMFPLAVHFMPEKRRVRLVKSYLGPAAPWWIKDRVQGKVPIFLHTQITAAERVGDRVRLRVREEGVGDRTIEVDHVIAGTGYVANVDRLPFLDDDLRRRLHRVERAPLLSVNFESSIAGMYFLGPIAAMCFGPLFRFVAGAKYAAPALARHIAPPVRTVTRSVRRWASGSSADVTRAA